MTLTVSDEGLGISSEDLPHICDPFYRSSEARRLGRPGVGLGLTVVQSSSRSWTAKCAFNSELGKGSRFSIYLSAAFDTAPPARLGAKPETITFPHPLWVTQHDDVDTAFIAVRNIPGILAFLMLLSVGCQKEEAPAEEEEARCRPVKWEAAEKADLEEWTELLGTTQPLPNHSAHISASLGRLRRERFAFPQGQNRFRGT